MPHIIPFFDVTGGRKNGSADALRASIVGFHQMKLNVAESGVTRKNKKRNDGK